MASSMMLTSLSTSTSVGAGGTIPLGSAIHGFGKDIIFNPNGAVLRSAGYYEVAVSVCGTGTAATTAQLYANGVAVPGAIASATPADAGGTVTFVIPWVYRKRCCETPTTLSVVLSAATTVTSMECVVKKL